MSPEVVTESILVRAPAAVVFDILADPAQHARIDGSGTVRGVVGGPERLSQGAQFGVVMKAGARYRMKNRVVEFEEGRLIAWRHGGPHRWRYQLEPTEEGTRVTESWDVSAYPAPARVVLGLLRLPQRTRRNIQLTLVRLKHAAESDAAGPPSAEAAGSGGG